MKKILLATTFLVATTGFASADVSFGGSAKMGVAKDAGFDANGDGILDVGDVAATDFETYSSAELTVAMAGETDNGLTFGADFAVSVGRSYTLGSEDGFADEGGFDPMPHVWIAGSYGKVTVADDDFDFHDDATGGGDVKYEHTFGVVGVELIADVDASEFSGKLSYTTDKIAASANFDTLDQYGVSLAYTLGVFTATIATNNEEDHSIRGDFANNGITAFAQYNALADGNQWQVGGSFATNGLSLGFEYNEAEEYKVTAGYDLGGGLALEAAVNQTGDVMIGAAMTF